MKRPVKAHRRRLLVEFLEARTLLSGNPDGMWPLPNPGPTTSIFVRFAANDTESRQEADLAPLGASVVTSYPDGPELITLGENVTPTAAIAKLEADPGVVYAAPDATLHAAAVTGLPNDPAFSQLWGLNNANNVDIDAPEAWGVTLGNPSTIVAVIDTGIDLNNPDFAGKIWTNPGNDAASGYANDIHGWNFVDNTPDVQDNDAHGTHVSAIIAATGDNGYGVVGVDPSAEIMPLKFLDANGNGSTDAAISAIYFAVAHGAKVINASWGGVGYSAPLNDAIAYANANNVVFVTAAGNDGTNNNVVPSYPSSYRQPNELSVAAIDQNGNLASFSNYGSGTVDLAAPGVDIISDVPTSIDPSGLQDLSGTSMSTAYVSGVAALVAGFNPTYTAAQIVARIDSTTKSLPSLQGKTISGGMVDAYNALAGTGTSAASAPVASPAGVSNAEVRSAILSSDEFFAANGGTVTGFVTGLYEKVLDRAPDPSGLQFLVNLYNSGTVSRYDIALDVVESAEGRDTEVAEWFQVDLGRTTSIADLKADPRVQAWANLILDGVGDNTVQAEIMSSSEYLIGHGASPVPVVLGYYEDLTDRVGDLAGVVGWAGLLVQGIAPFDVLRLFQSTDEAKDTLVATWFSQDLGRTETIAQLKADPGVQAWAAALGNL